jgi:hypothetical protein
MHFIQGFGAEVGRSGPTLHVQCFYGAYSHALAAKGAESGRISPLAIILMLYNPYRTGNTDIGAHATADTPFRLDLHWAMEVLRMGHFFG